MKMAQAGPPSLSLPRPRPLRRFRAWRFACKSPPRPHARLRDAAPLYYAACALEGGGRAHVGYGAAEWGAKRQNAQGHSRAGGRREIFCTPARAPTHASPCRQIFGSVSSTHTLRPATLRPATPTTRLSARTRKTIKVKARGALCVCPLPLNPPFLSCPCLCPHPALALLYRSRRSSRAASGGVRRR